MTASKGSVFELSNAVASEDTVGAICVVAAGTETGVAVTGTAGPSFWIMTGSLANTGATRMVPAASERPQSARRKGAVT